MKNNQEVKSPLDGILLNLSEVPDPVFAEKMVGDGFALDPTGDTLYSPVRGEVIQLHKANHAITIKTSTGVELLIHIGIDTVNLAGKGFKTLVKMGDQVEIGQPLIEFDLDFLAVNTKSLITPVLVLNDNAKINLNFDPKTGYIKTGDSFFSCEVGTDTSTLISTENAETYSKKLILTNPQGLHARPCAHIVSLAKSFEAQIFVSKGTQKVNATSLVSLLSLEATQGDELTIETQGPEAVKALDEISHYIENHKEAPTKVKEVTAKASHKKDTDSLFYGMCASDGIAIGKIVILEEDEVTIPHHIGNPTEDKELLETAITKSMDELSGLYNKMLKDFGKDKASIFTAHQEILEDPEIKNLAFDLIKNNKNSAEAWYQAYNKSVDALEKLNDSNLAARAADVRDVGRRVLDKLVSSTEQKVNLSQLSEETILVAKDLSPSDTAKLDKTKIKGFITCHGGTTSHVAIIARSLGIPAVVGASEAILTISSKTQAILNATEGELKISINEADIETAKKQIKEQEQRLKADLEKAHAEAITKDNVLIEVAANVTSLQDIENAREMGCDGVGLLRTEFIFMDKDSAPSLNEQTQIYTEMASELNKISKKPLVIRTLDVGGDKPLKYLPIDKEENPFLGERGIRVSLNHKDLFKEQITAIIKANESETIHIMFPMISMLDELLEAKEITLKIAKSLGANIKIGMMVEVPSTALMAAIFAPHVDFFSIGANDLTQYTMAIDRGHPKLAAYADGLNPSVLQLIKMTCDAAKDSGIWVGVCGGIASDIQAVPILLGLGVTELSVSIPMIPKVKAKVRELSLSDCQVHAEKCMRLATTKQVRELKL